MTWPAPYYFHRNVFYAITTESRRKGMLSIVML